MGKQQDEARKNILDTIRYSGFSDTARSLVTANSFVTTLGGFAGTGKTHLIKELRRDIKKYFFRLKIAFCTFTGKASSVLASKLNEPNLLGPNDYIGTIHSLIYKPKVRYDKKLKIYINVTWVLKEKYEMQYDLIIIDEASMVSKDIWDHLTSYDIPIIAVGDHGQLGPVADDSFNLMKRPDQVLTDIQRQLKGSAIIDLSIKARRRLPIPNNTVFQSDPPVLKLQWNSSQCQKIWNKLKFDSEVMAICNYNISRNYINRLVRKKLEYKRVEPYPGERVVCLQNNKDLGIMNGQTGTVYFLMPEKYKNTYRLSLQVDGQENYTEAFTDGMTFDQVKYTIYDDKDRRTKLYKYAMKNNLNGINYFDYAYCISVHKSQGSEWEKIVLFDQRNSYQDDEAYARWLYTGITRAKSKLLIVTDFYF